MALDELFERESARRLVGGEREELGLVFDPWEVLFCFMQRRCGEPVCTLSKEKKGRGGRGTHVFVGRVEVNGRIELLVRVPQVVNEESKFLLRLAPFLFRKSNHTGMQLCSAKLTLISPPPREVNRDRREKKDAPCRTRP